MELSDEDCKFYYDKQFEFILALIEPDEEVNNWIEKNRDKLQKVYNIGYEEAKKNYEKLKKYLEK